MLLCVCALAACATSKRPNDQDPAKVIQSFLAPHRGQVLLLLMGREGCTGTAKATEALAAYAPRKPDRVTILRLDAPLPGEDLKLVEEWPHAFTRRVDTGRAVADALDFFFYPTFYVFDPDGELRYTGGCDPAKMELMVNEILAEKPGQPKKSYNLPMPKPGDLAPAFSGNDLAGQSRTLAGLSGKKGTLLVFARTGCPFTVQALPSIQAVADACRKHDVAVAIINSGEDEATIRPIYAKYLKGVPVIWDQSGKISKAYGVDVTPFMFLLDSNGKVARHRSFTPKAATGAVNGMLGLTVETPRHSPKGAG